MSSQCKAPGCPRPVKSGGLCHVHLKEMSAPRVLRIGQSDFGGWQKKQNLERSWKKEVSNSEGRHARARRKRTSAIDNATPPWLSATQKKEIEALYEDARILTEKTGEKYEVDHIIPLRSEKVSGLHVPWNMRVISKKSNNQKGNRGESYGE